MTPENSTHDREQEPAVQRDTDRSKYEQEEVRATVLEVGGKGPPVEGRVAVIGPSGEDSSTVAVSVESEASTCVVGLEAEAAFALGDELMLAADHVPSTQTE